MNKKPLYPAQPLGWKELEAIREAEERGGMIAAAIAIIGAVLILSGGFGYLVYWLAS